MKKFEELSQEELIELTPEQIEFYVEYAVAVAGIPKLTCPVEPVQVEIGLVKKHDIWSIGGIYSCDAVLIEQIYQLIKSSDQLVAVNYNFECGYSERYYEFIKPYCVERFVACDRDTYRDYEVRLKKYKKDYEQYGKEKKIFFENYKEVEVIREGIEEKIELAISVRDKFLFHVDKFRDYLRLSQGNEEIARAFFEKAFMKSGNDIDLERVVEAAKGC